MRWTAMRKTEIIEAIQNGHLTPVEAKDQHGLSDEELAAWTRDYLAYGRAGLRVTKLQQYQPRRSRLKLLETANRRSPTLRPIPDDVG